MTTLGNLYIYLARRDKKGIKILSIIKGHGDFRGTRIQDIKSMNLDPKTEAKLQNSIYEHRMYWEPWAEGAMSYQLLRDSLKQRGHRNLPLYGKPEIDLEIEKVITEKVESPSIESTTKPKTMLRKRTTS